MMYYPRSGLIDNVSAKPGDIICDWKNKLSLWPNELLIFGAEPLRWLNGSDTLNIFEWLFGLKLLSELPGILTGADVPCKMPTYHAVEQNRNVTPVNNEIINEMTARLTRNWIR